MILLNPKYDIDVIKLNKDSHGRLIVLDTKMNGVNLVLMNLYAPNDVSQQAQFFEKVMNKLLNYTDENIIIGGDLNCPLTELDKIGGKPVENKKRVRDKISQLSDLHEYSLQDVWREVNLKEKQFTWRDKAYEVQCRLDYFLASQKLANLAKECSIVHALGSDHCVVKLLTTYLLLTYLVRLSQQHRHAKRARLIFLVIGVFVELFTVMIWFSFFGLRCTARRKLEIYNL